MTAVETLVLAASGSLALADPPEGDRDDRARPRPRQARAAPPGGVPSRVAGRRICRAHRAARGQQRSCRAIRVAVPVAVRQAAATADVEPVTDAAGTASSADQVSGACWQRDTTYSVSSSTILLAVWMLGATMFVLPVVIGLWQVRALRRSALPWRHGLAIAGQLAQQAGVRRRVDVLLHESVPGPMTFGVIHPTIVLPIDACAWTERRPCPRAHARD